MSGHYVLKNIATGKRFPDSGWLLEDPTSDASTLIRTEYHHLQLTVHDHHEGLYRFSDWLPIQRMLEGAPTPVTFKSKKLSKHLGIDNLYITFNGYFPEIGANMTSCTFKETEAYSVCGRMHSEEKRVLVVASAGNTARAFAKVCSENNIPLLLCVPEDNVSALWSDKPFNECVKLITTASGSDYFDAINLSNLAALSPRFLAEGGAKNVARRDGMGTTVLSAATHIGTIPNYYFQAVGSGTGAIAAFETNLRLLRDGRFGSNLMRLMVSQNIPFTPMVDAWKKNERTLEIANADEARKAVHAIAAKVLANRKPPYGVTGGLFDCLQATNGDAMAIDNETVHAAADLFEELEGIDIHPAAAVATASLIEHANNQGFKSSDIVMLNITGGGEKRLMESKEIYRLTSSKTFSNDPSKEEVVEFVEQLF